MSTRIQTVRTDDKSGPPSASAVIHLDRIHKIYSMGDIEVHALRGVSLDIHLDIPPSWVP